MAPVDPTRSFLYDTGKGIPFPMHDYHLHTHFCRHASGTLADYARAAIQRGIEEICFTPHIPMPFHRPGFMNNRIRMDIGDFPAYLEELERTREAFPGLSILCGVEADFVVGQEAFLEEFLASHPFDFVLMSVHFIHSWPEDQWVFDFTRVQRSIEQIYDDYLEEVRAGIRSGLFDSVAHFDLIKVAGKPLLATHRGQVLEIFDLCRRQGMSMEINTSGSRKEIGECYPSGDISLLMAERGVPLTPGSDAHSAAHVGFGLEKLAHLPFVRYRRRHIVECPRPVS
jgi:histidinol-phosphatase (PHP family)